MILALNSVSKAFGADNVLENVSFHIEEREKVAIVGVNGAGKSTLFKIITGQESHDKGDINMPKTATLGYFAQDLQVDSSKTIYEELLTVFEPILRMEAELRTLEVKMADKGADTESVMHRYAELSRQLEENDGYAYKSRIRGVISGLGFTAEEADQHINELSGGQKTRVALGKILLRSPDVLLLDEPTNHLDIDSIAWLEDFLRGYDKTVIIVSHDRYFLDRVVNKVIELENGMARVYTGSYTDYRVKREHDREAEMNAYLNQQREIKHQEEVIKKLREFNREKSVKRAESREKQLERMTPVAAPLSSPDSMRLSIEPSKQSGNDVLELREVGMTFTDKPLFRNVSFDIKRGERVALIGANGIGKTTLIRIIMDRLKQTSGSVKVGANVVIGYYDQEQADLSLNKTIFDEISDCYPTLTATRIRNVLAAFVFTGDSVFKSIGSLSGGEKGRVALAKLMLSNANLLILDEPTNHLDMESKQILENALNNYTGTVLYISHDRYFINSTAQKVIELTADGVNTYLGNYDYYIEKRQTQTVESKSVAVETEAKSDWQEQKAKQAVDRKLRNTIKRLEKDIEQTEKELDEVSKQLEDSSVATDAFKAAEVYKQVESLEERLMELYEEYEKYN